MKNKKCLNCKKWLVKQQLKYCSRKCKYIYEKENKINPFCRYNFQSEMGKRVKHKTHVKSGNKVKELHPKQFGEMGKLGGVRTQRIFKKQHKNFYNSTFQSEMGRRGGKIGGLIATKILRQKKRIIFKGLYCASYKECEISMCIYYQIGKLFEGKTFQIKIDSLTYDFLIEKYKCFIECHPFNSLYDDLNDKELIKYYKKKRNTLNKSGYKEYNLILIK